MNIPSREEMRLALMARHGKELHNKFEKSTVAVCGLGGLGSGIAVSLVRAGVGKLILIDFDRVDISNLNRQQYKACQTGMFKTEALKENLYEISPYALIETYTVKITEKNAKELLEPADVICEAFDKAKEKAMLVNTVLSEFPEKYTVAASGMAGLNSANLITTKKAFRRLYICGDGVSDAADTPLIAPRVLLCAAHQAHMVLRILSGFGEA